MITDQLNDFITLREAAKKYNITPTFLRRIITIAPIRSFKLVPTKTCAVSIHVGDLEKYLQDLLNVAEEKLSK